MRSNAVNRKRNILKAILCAFCQQLSVRNQKLKYKNTFQGLSLSSKRLNHEKMSLQSFSVPLHKVNKTLSREKQCFFPSLVSAQGIFITFIALQLPFSTVIWTDMHLNTDKGVGGVISFARILSSAFFSSPKRINNLKRKHSYLCVFSWLHENTLLRVDVRTPIQQDRCLLYQKTLLKQSSHDQIQK